MLRKRRLDDGGLDVQARLIGPAVFLDVWAVRELSREASSGLRDRFTRVIKARSGSLFVSSAWVTELDALKGDARRRAQAFFTSLGEHWLLINPIVSSVAAREARDEIGAYLSLTSLEAYVKERCGEVLSAGRDPHALTDAEFFDLGRTLAWAAADDPTSPAQSTALAQAQALKEEAKVRADRDKEEQRRDRGACELLYPKATFASGRMRCVHNAVWREATRRSLGRTWMPNDGFDITHLIPALTIGGFIAVDSDWQDIGQTAARDLAPDHARLYRPGELERLVADLEA